MERKTDRKDRGCINGGKAADNPNPNPPNPKLGEKNQDEAAVLPAATNRIPPPRMMFLLLL